MNELSAHEINKLILSKLGITSDCFINDKNQTITRHCIAGATLDQAYGIDYCQNNEDIMPLAWQHKINITWRCHVWNASVDSDDESYTSDINPLRAIAQCYLNINSRKL